MYCPAVDGFYLKANGSFVCWSSPGEETPLLRVDPERLDEVDLVDDILNHETLRTMRRALHSGEPAFDYCHACVCGEPGKENPWSCLDLNDFALRRIRTLMVEPSYLCNVDCPLCVRLHERTRSMDPPHVLDPVILMKLVDDLARHGIAVDVCQFSGRGEPLLSRDFAVMMRYVKDRLGPETACDTNGNVPFRPEYMTCGLDWMVIALDGVTQASYERYRRGGRLSRVLELARDCVAFKRANPTCETHVSWKMILFEWNSSDDEVREAIRLANEIGVDELRFVQTTTSGGVSYDDGGVRIRELKERIDDWATRSSVAVRLWGYDPDPRPGRRARVRLSYEVPSNPTSRRLDLKVWAFNEMPEPLGVRAHVRAVPSDGGSPHLLRRLDAVLPERDAWEQSFTCAAADSMPGGRYGLRVDLEDATTGKRLDRFEVPIFVPA